MGNMKCIQLSKGEQAIVDDADFDYLNQWKWYLGAHGYAVRQVFNKDKYTKLAHAMRYRANEIVYMHRLVNDTPEGFVTDHINQNPLDNRRQNLRSVGKSINGLNRGRPQNNTSGVKGVYWQANAWVAELKLNGKKLYLGRHKNIDDAAQARRAAELSLMKV
jgi:hypothetical protein